MEKYAPGRDPGLTEALKKPRSVYIAGPFFTDEQVVELERVERVLDAMGISFFSPRLECRYEKGDARLVAQRCMYLNEVHCEISNIVLACLSWPDTGTAWEMGWAKRCATPVLGYTKSDNVLMNLMIAQSVDALIPANKLSGCLYTMAKSLLLEHSPRNTQRIFTDLGIFEETFTTPEINE